MRISELRNLEAWSGNKANGNPVFTPAVKGCVIRLEDTEYGPRLIGDLGTPSDAIAIAKQRGQGATSTGAYQADNAARYDGTDWLGYQTLDDIERNCESPRRWLLNKVDDIKSQIESELRPPVHIRRRVRHGLEAGDELDSQAWLTRKLDGWSEVQRDRHQKRVFNIGVSLSANCNRKASEFVWRGACVAAIADLLSERGHSVGIVGVGTSAWKAGYSERNHSLVPLRTKLHIKDSHRPMSLANVLTPIADIAFYRRVVLPTYARLSPVGALSGLGREASMPEAELHTLDLDVMLDANIWNMRDAVTEARRIGESIDE